VRAEAPGIDRGGRHDHLEIGPVGHDVAQIAEEEVDVEAALVRLVHDDRVVGVEGAVALRLREQDAVRHHLDERVRRRLVVETHLVAHDLAELRSELIRETGGDAAGRDAARLGDADGALDAEPELQADLRKLRRLAGARLAAHHHDLVGADRLGDRLPVLDDGQRLVEAHRRALRRPLLAKGDGALDVVGDPQEPRRPVRGPGAAAGGRVEAPAEARAVGAQARFDAVPQAPQLVAKRARGRSIAHGRR
jgi:hypothetical protein